ncbi:DUF2750 domain-containing protein [Acinetobacter gerneri]|jgi:hypothetical protein|uniref:DUF2750 domain-containing protein n=1 Tax=Acinetobacter gerneri TaxID=202952 RepID=A0AAW8JGM5_9GAMM|nr:DUF2750 domain-containing protein [Acinetobacter gerneri]MCH4244433.1 DUF2750 domain-containing protein [Acinetobacter gerneri]MDQ9009660.1 DUF2750 domain-containing protein [Acinetobacter gerneri]MDQ9013632.1 DUF2750 domain-containing protein [Acinetobacter gerneri]MDQ9025046.1 DUF2750 domain-containing protein [Acinetobacter gerneri]MDQ9050809.1 DUF2750 domain-containing protein [Acinetobacter gerneri]
MKNPYQRKTSAKSKKSQSTLSPKDAYIQFLNKICHQACVYSIYNNGWTISTLVSGERAFPFWQSETLARLVLQGQWADFEIREISFKDLIERVLPYIKQQHISVALDISPDGKYLPSNADSLMIDLKRYLYLLKRTDPQLFSNQVLPEPRKLRINF